MYCMNTSTVCVYNIRDRLKLSMFLFYLMLNQQHGRSDPLDTNPTLNCLLFSKKLGTVQGSDIIDVLWGPGIFPLSPQRQKFRHVPAGGVKFKMPLPTGVVF